MCAILLQLNFVHTIGISEGPLREFHQRLKPGVWESRLFVERQERAEVFDHLS